MEETEIKCPDCGKFLTDVDGMLECQGEPVLENGEIIGWDGCGGHTGWTDEDWMVWYPGPGMPPNPTQMDMFARREFMQREKK